MVKEIDFHKMQGLGNDYVYIVSMDSVPDNLATLARDISDRHYGVGGDGLVVVTNSKIADFRMIMFNSDGSEAQMCGNASRCIGKLVYQLGLTEKREFTLETKAGVREIKLNFNGDNITDVSVNMGKPFLTYSEIPVIKSQYGSLMPVHNVVIEDKSFEIYCAGMGNPHGVIFTRLEDDDFKKFGPLLEINDIWPEKANIEFVEVVDPHLIEMRVWERGTGETLACGTGACASAVVSILTGKTENNLTVRMKGGELKISINKDDEVIMTGDAQYVAHGVYYWNYEC